MKRTLQKIRRGFTLLELTIAIFLGVAAGGMLMSLFQLQLTFLNVLRDQNFLVEDAPLIGNYMNRIVGKADSFRLYANQATAAAQLAGTATLGTRGRPVVGAVPTFASTAATLNYRQADTAIADRSVVLFFGTPPGGAVQGLYLQSDPAVASYLLLSARPAAVGFSIVDGVLEMQLTGPRGELITYAGTMQQ